MTTKKNLLIHKEPNMQEVVQACLTDLAGWNVRVTNSTLEGLRQAKIYQPDSIILDISLGEMDELEFIKKLRIQPATQAIPVVVRVDRGIATPTSPSEPCVKLSPHTAP